MKTSSLAPLMFCMLLVAGCGEELPSADHGAGDHGSHHGRQNARAELIAATVDGEPILIADVEELVMSSPEPLPPREALDILVRQTLLAREAERRGWGRPTEVELEREKALAAALIKKTARDVAPSAITEEELRARYDKQRIRFVRGPGRRVVHVLARTGKKGVSSAEARSALDIFLRELSETGETVTPKLMKKIAKRLKKEEKLKLKYEKLPPFTENNEQFLREFVDAAFSIKEVGAMAKPVETRFGWHAILLVKKFPPIDIPFDDARKVLLSEMLPPLRKARTDELIEELLSRQEIFVYETALNAGAAP